MGDIGARRGSVESIGARGNARVIRAIVPLAETFDYVPSLRNLTHGRGTATTKPAGYAVAPANVAAKVL